MDETESYQTTTSSSIEGFTATDSPEAISVSTIVSQITELMAESSTDVVSTSTENSFHSMAESGLKFSVADYAVFGIMLAMSG
jgi:hypothetical protein